MTKVARNSLFGYSNQLQQGDVCLHNSVSRIFNSHSAQFPFIYFLQVPALIYEENYKQKQNKEAFSEILTLFYLPIFMTFQLFRLSPGSSLQRVIRTICIYSDLFYLLQLTISLCKANTTFKVASFAFLILMKLNLAYKFQQQTSLFN